MRQVRSMGLAKPVSLEGRLTLDIELMDIQVFFDGSLPHFELLMQTNPDSLLEENFKHLDLVTQGAIHT